MNLKTRKKILLTICLVCSLPGLTVFAGTDTFQTYNSAGNVFASATITYSNGTLVDSIWYGASVGGQDASAITSSNPASITIAGNKSGSVSKTFYYGNPLTSGSKTIGVSNTYINVTLTIDGASKTFKLYD